MKWITRENANVDRIACPWLMKHLNRPKPEKEGVNCRKKAEDLMSVKRTSVRASKERQYRLLMHSGSGSRSLSTALVVRLPR